MKLSADAPAPIVDYLSRHTEQIMQAVARSDFALATQLVENDLLSSWYGLSPHEFTSVVETLMREGAPTKGLIYSTYQFLRPRAEQQIFRATVTAPDEAPTIPAKNFGMLAKVFHLRLSGHPVAALNAAQLISDTSNPVSLVVDMDSGWGLFFTVQKGLTAMLAGDFFLALSCFTQVRMHAFVPQYAFLHREAYLNAALIQGGYGDLQTAESLLRQARTLPKTSSWAEDGLKCREIIAEVLMGTGDPNLGYSRLQELSLHDVGEVWPFYILALHRCLLAARRVSDAETELAIFDDLALPRTDGEGFSGSILPVLLADIALREQDIGRAEAYLKRADPSIVTTRIMQLLVNVYAGRMKGSLREAHIMHPHAQGLRQLEIWRLSIVSGCYFGLDEQEQCLAVLAQALSLPGGLSSLESQSFFQEVRVLAAQTWSSWPPESELSEPYLRELPVASEQLSEREHEILMRLADRGSRQDIADALYISMNTLKTHLRSMYRKLSAENKTQALEEAARRGLLARANRTY